MREIQNKARLRPRFFFLLVMFSSQVLACDFPAAKKEIDQVLDVDKEKAVIFRKQMAAGYDSLDVLGKMLSAAAREKVEQCRFEAGEYLTKRGFPPAH